MSDGYIIRSEETVRLLEEMAEEYRRRKHTTQQRPREGNIDHQEHQAPEVYIVLTPPDGIPGRVGDVPGAADCNCYAVRPQIGLQAMSPLFETVLNLSVDVSPASEFLLAHRDKNGSWVLGGGGGTALSGFWAQLTGKYYPPPPAYTQYYWERVLDTDVPYGILWPEPGLSGGPGNFPAYEVNNVDLPVDVYDVDFTGTGSPPTFPEIDTFTGTGTFVEAGEYKPIIVWLTKGRGNYYLINMVARWEFVRKDGAALSNGTWNGFLDIWDQYGKAWVDTDRVVILDANAPP